MFFVSRIKLSSKQPDYYSVRVTSRCLLLWANANIQAYFYNEGQLAYKKTYCIVNIYMFAKSTCNWTPKIVCIKMFGKWTSQIPATNMFEKIIFNFAL